MKGGGRGERADNSSRVVRRCFPAVSEEQKQTHRWRVRLHLHGHDTRRHRRHSGGAERAGFTRGFCARDFPKSKRLHCESSSFSQEMFFSLLLFH